MALVDRLQHVGSVGDTVITIHDFTAGLVLLANGSITRAQMISIFNLVGSDVSDLDALIAKYNSKADAVSKITFIWVIESAGLFYENGTINATQYKSILGF